MKADKTKRGEMLNWMVENLITKGYSKGYAIERVIKWMEDPIRLRIINALSA